MPIWFQASEMLRPGTWQSRDGRFCFRYDLDLPFRGNATYMLSTGAILRMQVTPLVILSCYYHGPSTVWDWILSSPIACDCWKSYAKKDVRSKAHGAMRTLWIAEVHPCTHWHSVDISDPVGLASSSLIFIAISPNWSSLIYRDCGLVGRERD